MLNKLKKYKYILLLLLLFFIFVFGSVVKATTSIAFTYNNEEYSVILPADDFAFYTISYCTDGKFYLNATKDSSCTKALYLTGVSGVDSRWFAVRFQDSSGNNLNEARYYSYDLKNWKLTDSGWNGLVRDYLESFCYSNIDIYDSSNNVIFNKSSFTSTFYCFPDKEYTKNIEDFKFSQIISVEYDLQNYNNYNAYVSFDGVNWEIMNKEIDNIDNYFIFYYDVFENGTYQVKVFDDITGSYIYEGSVEVDNIPFDIILEPSEDTDKPIVAKTNIFNSSMGLSVLYSTDKKDWKYINSATLEKSSEESPDFNSKYFWTRIFKNGTYYFKFHLLYDTNGNDIDLDFYVTKEIKNLMVEDYMSNDYIFKPIISLGFNEETQAFVVRTQSILLDKALNLNCFYITYEKTEGFNPNEKIEDSVITGWNKMEIDFENNIYMGTSDAYFYFEIPIINATDTNYKIAFYNYISEKSSEIVYYDFVYKDAKDYVENDLNAHLGINVRLNDFLKNIESHFGILGFPMAVVRNFCNKILTLQAKEPIIYIPELYEPFYHNKIYNGISFNFNSLLVNDSVVFIHEFYLTIVDMIFIYLFLVYCVKTLKAFIENNKND